MEQIDNLKLINQDVDIAIKQLDQLLQDDSVEKIRDMLYYLQRNAYRKRRWKQALDNYQYAIDLNPDSPTVQARTMAIDIPGISTTKICIINNRIQDNVIK